MNSEFFEAVYSLFATVNDFNTAVSGKLEYGRAQESWSDNYAVIQGLDAHKNNTFRTTINDVYFQINCFSSARETCWDLLKKCVTLFDKAKITPTGHYKTRITCENQMLPIWNERDRLYQATAEFMTMIQET